MKEIVLTDPRVKEGSLEYKGEYIVLSFVGEIDEDFVVDNNYNIYMGGEKLEREEY